MNRPVKLTSKPQMALQSYLDSLLEEIPDELPVQVASQPEVIESAEALDEFLQELVSVPLAADEVIRNIIVREVQQAHLQHRIVGGTLVDVLNQPGELGTAARQGAHLITSADAQAVTIGLRDDQIARARIALKVHKAAAHLSR